MLRGWLFVCLLLNQLLFFHVSSIKCVRILQTTPPSSVVHWKYTLNSEGITLSVRDCHSARMQGSLGRGWAVWSRVQRKPRAGFQWPLTLVLLYMGKCSYMGFIHIQYTFCILVNYLYSLFTISPFSVMIFLWVTSLFGNKFTLAFSITWAINLTLSTLLLEFVFSILSWTFSIYFRMDEKSWKQSIDPNTEHTWGGTVP